jgi:chromosome segregation ATPase
MDNEKIIAVLTELLEEQKEMSRSQAETRTAIQQLKEKLESVEEAIKSHQSVTPQIDLKPVQQSIERNFAHLKLSMDILTQKPPSNNLRVFMESDAKNWAVYLLVATIFLTYLFCFAIRKA